ncbi:MAG: carbon-nitrogen hydrolase family protein [Caulobacteraceae bacterium]|nr:MAG: carbon-nitrogen hydrolase family protein [Caulobacteraceae bacterium]
MTKNANFKRRVRARAAKTGESYTASLRHLRETTPVPPETGAGSLLLAVAQTTLCNDPRDIAALRATGEEMRSLMRRARQAGARLIHFPEGATCSPNKRIMSLTGLREIGPSDWSRVEWAALRAELDAIRREAAKLGLWAVFGSVHPLTPPHRPHNSLYVVSDRGELVTRYDERMLSATKISFMYAPGRLPITFEVDGLRFGCTLGMEAHYPEIFGAYEALDVDCVLFSTTGETSPNAPAFAAEVLGHASANSFWVSYAAHAAQSETVPSGIAAPDGLWAAQCTMDGQPSFAIATITVDPAHQARPWRRSARGGIYDAHQIHGDPKSERRDSF